MCAIQPLKAISFPSTNKFTGSGAKCSRLGIIAVRMGPSVTGVSLKVARADAGISVGARVAVDGNGDGVGGGGGAAMLAVAVGATVAVAVWAGVGATVGAMAAAGDVV